MSTNCLARAIEGDDNDGGPEMVNDDPKIGSLSGRPAYPPGLRVYTGSSVSLP